ncbi:MAG: S1 RNA-binding domain-containing protein, partial [Nitrospirae bacterium]|nr:S1 RNA-binding domain-containing protein [Nitrospirota bacterium]
IEGCVEGLIYASEIAKQEGREYTEGEIIKSRIIKLDIDQRKIGLSMINYSKKGSKEE